MTDHSTIEWTDRTWNPVTGCTKVSAGCDHCYAETIAERFRGGPAFTNGFDVQLRQHKLTEPLRWRKPSKVFVNSMSDLFHDEIPDEYIESVFSVMAEAKQHTFQILTKRHARMRSLLSRPAFAENVKERYYDNAAASAGFAWPLPNVWIGVSVEDQKWADIRIPALLMTPAAVRFISAEPLLGPIEFEFDHYYDNSSCGGCSGVIGIEHEPSCGIEPGRHWGLDWVIVGGESGRGARAMHPQWARDIRDQCVRARVPFLFKQFGAWAPADPDAVTGKPDVYLGLDGKGTYYAHRYRDDVAHMICVGKAKAGRELDGRTWDQFPEVAG